MVWLIRERWSNLLNNGGGAKCSEWSMMNSEPWGQNSPLRKPAGRSNTHRAGCCVCPNA